MKIDIKKIKFNITAIILITFLMAGCDTYDETEFLDYTLTPSKTTSLPKASITPNRTKTVIILTATPEGTATIPPTMVLENNATAEMIADKYEFLGQNPADNTVVSPGSLITITWSIKNSGTVGWTADYSIRYFSGVEGKKNSYLFTEIIAVDRTLNISANLTAPTIAGTYTTWWKLTNAKNQNFGDLDFTFTVSN